MEKANKKKVLSWINLVLSAAIFAFALSVFIMSFTARARNDRVELFGYSFAVVATNSMYDEIKAGDLIIVKSCDITEIEEGQNAVFIGLSGEFEGKSIVHKVVGIYDDFNEAGEKIGIYLETWGINNPFYDDDYVREENFIGREVFHSTALGAVMVFLREPINWIYLLVILLAVSFAAKQGAKIIKLVKNKKKVAETETVTEAVTETETEIETKIEKETDKTE